MTAKRHSCPSCATVFNPDRSNQRYCSIECRQYGSNVRRKLVVRVKPEEFRKRRKEKLCNDAMKATEGPQSAVAASPDTTHQKLCNDNGKALEHKAPSGHFRPPIPGWTGHDGDRGFRVFLPYQIEPLNRLQCIQIGVKYPAIDRGVYRVL